jgi:hypothetical protein
MQPFNLQPVQYTFQTTTQWQTSGVPQLPYGSSEDTGNASLLIWQFPSGLLNQLALPKEQGSAFSIQIGQYDAQGRDGLLTIFFLRMEYHGRYRNQTARYRFHGL